MVYRVNGGDHAGRRTPPFRVNCRHRPDSVSMTNSCFDPVRVDEKIRWRLSGAHDASSLLPSLVCCFTLRS